MHGRADARAVAFILLCVGASVHPSPPLVAQALRTMPPVVSARLRDSTAATPLLQRPWVRPVSSLLVPGSGQLASGRSRGLVYLATEVWLISRVIESGRSGRQVAGEFRALIFDVARKQFTPTRTDGPWDYYEAAEKFVASGVYNANPSGAFTPEPDTTTFNGALWLLARRTYFVNPDSTPAPLSAPYQAALQFYMAHAVPDALRYSWSGARLEQDVYRTEIRNSDNAFRARTNYLGVLVLNHLVSAIDALITLRLGHRPAAAPRVEIQPDASGPPTVLLAWSRDF